MIIIRYKPLKSGKYSVYLDINNNGQRSYEFLKIYTKHDYSLVKRISGEDVLDMQKVEQIKSKRHLETIDENNGISFKKKENFDFLKYIKSYSVNNSDHTGKSLHYHLNIHSGGSLKIRDVTYSFIETFKKYLEKTLKSNSQRAYLAKLQWFLNDLVKRELILDHNFKGVKIPSFHKGERTTLTLEEVRKLADHPVKFNIQIKQAFLFSCFSGLRMADIYALKWSNINNGIIKIIPNKTKKKERVVEFLLPPTAMKILSEVEKCSEKVFSKLPTDPAISKHLRVWGLEAKVGKHIHFHCSRHTFATLGITAGIDIYTMMQLLGHSKIEMTQIYAKIVDEKKNSEISKFPSL